MTYHIPTELKPGEPNNHSKALFLVPCSICKENYEVRQGQWLPMYTKKGTEVHIMVCQDCYAKETQKSNQHERTLPMELFRVTSTLDNFPHKRHYYNQVKMHWFVIDRRFPVVSYKKVVAGFEDLPEKDKAFAREYAKEMFMAREAKLLKKYLETSLGWKADITSCELPVEGRCLGFRAHQIGGLSGFLELSVGSTYNVPFKVWGYYTVEGLEPIGGFVDTISEFITRVRRRVSGLVDRHSPKEDKSTV